MYDAADAVYCYPDSGVLRNRAGLRNAEALQAFEVAMTAQRAEEALPDGLLSAGHYRAIHHHLFQDVYEWAGQYRVVRLAKGGNAFCYPEHIADSMERLFDGLRRNGNLGNLDSEAFALAAAHFLAELNAIHPFREGNGRAQNAFLALLSHQAGHRLDFSRLEERAFLEAVIRSFSGDEAPLAREIRSLIA